MLEVQESSKLWQAMEWEQEFRQQVACDDLEAAAFAREAANMYARLATLEAVSEVTCSIDLLREDAARQLRNALAAIRFRGAF